jgi:general secretion pathway protein D
VAPGGGSTNAPSALFGAPEQPVAVAPAAGATNAAPDEPLPQGLIDFRGASLEQVLDIYGMMVNRTILRPSNLAAQPIILKTQGQLTMREGIQALVAVLGMNGITIINVDDKFAKAVQATTAFQEAAPWSRIDPTNLPAFGGYITHVVQLKYARPTEMVQVLQPFAKIANSIYPIDSSQILVLRDFTENVKRMLDLIAEIDVAIPSEFEQEVIPIKYSLASEIANAITSLSTGGGGGTGTSVGGARTSTSTSGLRSSTSSGFNRPGMGQTPYGGASPYGNQPGMTGGVQPGSSGTSFSDRLQNIIKKVSSSGEIVVLGQTKIIADERTNSLLIFASHEDMEMIKKIISKLDVVLAQVLIEAVIIEVTLNNGRDLGVSYLETSSHGPGHYLNGHGAINTKGFLTDSSFSALSNSAPSLAGGFNYLAHLGGDLDVTLQAVANDSRAKILQRPRIQVSHAEQATLFVGESRPYPTSSYYGGGSYGGYASIQQLQIGVTLEVKPLINTDGLVVMDIHQKIESANGTVNLPNVGEVPITSQKDAVSKVAVRDRDTIILGGLIETSKTKSASGVPLLMDIPMLGYLFRSTSDKEVRNELIVMIRPTVLPTPEVAALTARAEQDKMPGVRSVEAEVDAYEAKRLKKANDEAQSLKRKNKTQEPQFSPVPIGN